MSGLPIIGRIGRRLGSAVCLAIGGALLPLPAAAGSGLGGCFATPSACGYPDRTNTGSTGALTASGSLTASTDGQVIEGREVTGSITVKADDVTIRNSHIVASATGGGSCAICAESHTGLRVIDSTISGSGAGAQTAEAAVRDYGSATIEGSDLSLCNECIQGGSITVRDSYIVVSSIYAGAHAEDIYICSDEVDVGHSTLLNEQNQTATVFGDTICGAGNDFVVTDSLLAGGGYVLYPQANSSSAVGSTRIAGNRFGRCATSPVYNPGSGGTACGGGGDSSGIFPFGGYYGLAAYAYSGPDQIWEGNVWDDDSQPVCADGRTGCGSVTLPEWADPPGGTPAEPAPPTAASPGEPAAPSASHRPTATGASPTTAPVRAVWRLPRGARPGRTLSLNGLASRGARPISCTWTVKNRSGSFLRRHRGCRLRFRVPRSGVRYVTLTVRDRDGDRDSLRRAIRGQGRSAPS